VTPLLRQSASAIKLLRIFPTAVVILLFQINLLQAAPNTNEAHRLIAGIISALKTGATQDLKPGLDEKIEKLQQYLLYEPVEAPAHFALGVCHQVAGNLPAAIHSMDRAYYFSDKDPAIGLTLALYLKMNRQMNEALKVHQELTKLHGKHPDLLLPLIAHQIGMQKYKEAMKLIEGMLGDHQTQITPKIEGMGHLMLGTCALHLGEHEKSIDHLGKALELLPKTPVIHATLGEALLKMNKFDQALTQLDRALEIKPGIPAALYYRGICLEKMKRPVEAIESFQQSFDSGVKELPKSQENGTLFFIISLACKKLNMEETSKMYREEANRLYYRFEAPYHSNPHPHHRL
jgi:tetratricopeptide (TPR) repeat protein